jgi:hypothetical protein
MFWCNSNIGWDDSLRQCSSGEESWFLSPEKGRGNIMATLSLLKVCPIQLHLEKLFSKKLFSKKYFSGISYIHQPEFIRCCSLSFFIQSYPNWLSCYPSKYSVAENAELVKSGNYWRKNWFWIGMHNYDLVECGKNYFFKKPTTCIVFLPFYANPRLHDLSSTR